MKQLPFFILMTFITTSCAQMMASFKEPSPDKTEENIPKLYSLIKKGDLDGALKVFQEGMGKTGVSFYDKKGNSITLGDYTFQGNDAASSHKRFIRGVKKLQGCLEGNTSSLDMCLKNVLADKENGDLIGYRYPVNPMGGGCLDNADKSSGDHIDCRAKYSLIGLKKNICGLPYTYTQPNVMGKNTKENEHSWGSYVTSFVFNSSYTTKINELKTIRASNYCK